ncbi:MAG: cob(I)yrinic acid a,c-diamide adenosyltransferase [Chloroflexota bacterium]
MKSEPEPNAQDVGDAASPDEPSNYDLSEEGRAAQRAAQEEHRRRELIEGGQYDIVILNEMTYCFKFGWLDLAEVLEALTRRPPHLHVVITGRDALEELIDFADLVTEMREIKHPYKSGVKAQKGIEF